jgi:hypothetical protein
VNLATNPYFSEVENGGAILPLPIRLHVIELNYINKDGDNFAFFTFTDEQLSLLLAWLILRYCRWRYMFLRNVAELLPDYKLIHPRRRYSSKFSFLYHYIK